MSPSESTAVVAREQAHPIVQALEQRSDVIAALLPKAADLDRFKRVVLQSINRNPDLKKCSPNSIVDAAAEAARLGLEPSGAIGGAHLVPYGRSAQLIVDYRGLVELARRSGEIAAIDAAIVRQADRFRVRRGTEPSIEHEPDIDAPSPADPTDAANPVTHVYAVARLRNGQRQFDVMTFDEIERIRGRSRAGNAGPWRTDWHEMAKKTVLRRLSKTLPLTVEVRAQLEMEDQAERPPVVVVEGGSADRLGGLRGAMRRRTAQLSAKDEPEAAVEEATVAAATRPTSRKRGNQKSAPSESTPADGGKGSVDGQGDPAPAPTSEGAAEPAADTRPADGSAAPSLASAQNAVWQAAVSCGLIAEDADPAQAASWAPLDQITRDALNADPDKMTPAEWQAFAERISAGEWDPADA